MAPRSYTLDGSQIPHSGIPHTLANISAELCVAAGVSVSKGRCWFWLWAIKVFFCWNWLVERNQRSCGVQQTHCLWDFSVLAVLFCSSAMWQHDGGGPGDLWGQVNQGCNGETFWAETEHSDWWWVGGTHWSFGSYGAVMMFRYHWFCGCFAFGSNSSLLPSLGTTTSSDGSCQSLAHLVLLILDLPKHLEAFQWRH